MIRRKPRKKTMQMPKLPVFKSYKQEKDSPEWLSFFYVILLHHNKKSRLQL
jgi:hypothetical protein